jgi:uncharacterized RDD family membrane protein YckC
VTVPDLCRSYDSSDLARRWVAFWFDLIGVILLVSTMALVFPPPEGNLVIAYVLGLAVAYHTLTEGLLGFSPGKWLCGIRVVATDGALPGLGRALTRTVARLIEANPILLGGIPAGLVADFSPTQQRIGDMLARTFVVKLEDLHRELPASDAGRFRGPYCRFLNSKKKS